VAGTIRTATYTVWSKSTVACHCSAILALHRWYRKEVVGITTTTKEL
jgi:hypothetical protein